MRKKKTYAIIGLGRFGMPLAKTLAEAGEEVIGVDQDEERVKIFREYSNYAFVAKTLSREVLEEIGVQNCDMAVICIGSKIETSIMVTLHALRLGVPKVVSKATSAEQGEVLQMLGAKVVYPERDMALRTAKKILRENLVDYISIGNDVEITEVAINEQMAGKSIVEMDVRKHFHLNIIAIHHEGEIETNIDPHRPFALHDTMVVIGKAEDVTTFVDHYA